MTAQVLSQEVLDQLQVLANSGNAKEYYDTLASYGHTYGILAAAAATNGEGSDDIGSTFAGMFANNYIEFRGQYIHFLAGPRLVG